MNTEKLSARLEAVARFIPEGHRLADIGSDHAYLPCHVVNKGKVKFVIAGEVVEGPYQSAKKQVEQEGLTGSISVRKGDGLEVIHPGEVDCITIAGMGGALIASILENGNEKLVDVKRLVLQPNISAISIRSWLNEHEWELVAEEILEEDNKIYEILVAEKGNPLKSYNQDLMETELLLGPFLMRERTDTFVRKWSNEIKNWNRIIQQIEQASQTEENIQKKQELQRKINMVEEVLNG